MKFFIEYKNKKIWENFLGIPKNILPNDRQCFRISQNFPHHFWQSDFVWSFLNFSNFLYNSKNWISETIYEKFWKILFLFRRTLMLHHTCALNWMYQFMHKNIQYKYIQFQAYFFWIPKNGPRKMVPCKNGILEILLHS